MIFFVKNLLLGITYDFLKVGSLKTVFFFAKDADSNILQVFSHKAIILMTSKFFVLFRDMNTSFKLIESEKQFEIFWNNEK